MYQMIQDFGQKNELININVGILGHVDAGKTTLAKLLSTTASTACFDRNPQSQNRGITLDIGFSSFKIDDKRQITLVDCPGHSSLFRMVLGAARIIDAVILVIDSCKGFQVQTAECLVLAEIVCDVLIVALTKTDLIPLEERDGSLETITSQIRKTLSVSKFSQASIIIVSPFIKDAKDHFIKSLSSLLPLYPKRDVEGSLIIAIDHGFVIKGQGSIVTGTILRGLLSIDDILEFPYFKQIAKVKAIQSFKRPVNNGYCGNRVGINLGSFNVTTIEKTIAAAPGVLNGVYSFLMSINKIPYYKFPLHSKSKIHLSVLHSTDLVSVTFLRSNQTDNEYELLENLEDNYVNEVTVALIESSTPIIAPEGMIAIGIKWDLNQTNKACRLAFHGTILKSINSVSDFKQKMYLWKEKMGIIDRMVDDFRLIGRELTLKSWGLLKFIGFQCQIADENGSVLAEGRIESPFGSSGKFNITIISKSHTLTSKIIKSCQIRVRYKKYMESKR